MTLAVEGEPYADIALDDELEFRMLVVDPAVQRSGAGQAMVQAIIDARQVAARNPAPWP